MTRIAIVYATLGRPRVLREVVDLLTKQTRQPDIVVVSAVTEADTAGIEDSPIRVETLYGSKGSSVQRNRALDHVRGRADIVLFLDDDFVGNERYLEETVRVFDERPDVVGATARVIADGIKTPGYSLDEALAMIADDVPPDPPRVTPRDSLYGCNMAMRVAALGGLRFDERLPLYGWLEDIDLTYRLSKRGTLVTSDLMAGVHMGVKGGRTSGVRFGYSQIANPIYMLRRGTIPRRMAFERMGRNFISNLLRSARPEPYVDRAGRLRGNLIALRDFVTGRVDPERILTMD